MDNKDQKLWLSASKIDKYLDCSWLYFCRYILKLPDTSNDGANRGNVVHEILELLLKPKHRKHFDKIISEKTITKCAAIWRLTKILAKRFSVNTDKNLEMIDSFILVALNHEFFGPEETEEILGEREFSLEINENGVRFNIRGFIDKTFIIRDKKGLIVRIADYKSSKAKYDNKKLQDNVQNMMYQLSAKYLYPNIARREFSFLFLKFKNDPALTPEPLNEDSLGGFTYFLSELQNKLENFKEKNAGDNFAAQNKEKSWLCGREGYKKNGEKNWICAARLPFKYFVSLDESGKILKSAFKKEDLDPNSLIEERSYSGCKFWFDDRGNRRNYQ